MSTVETFDSETSMLTELKLADQLLCFSLDYHFQCLFGYFVVVLVMWNALLGTKREATLLRSSRSSNQRTPKAATSEILEVAATCVLARASFLSGESLTPVVPRVA